MNNHKSIESYLKSARKYKSPISNEKVRTLIESKKNIPSSNFKNKRKGVIIMTLSVLLITGIILINSIYQENDKIQVKNENVIERMNEKQEMTASNSIEKKTEKEQGSKITATKEKNKAKYEDDTKAKDIGLGLNTITLDEIELNKLGLYFDKLIEGDKIISGISFWQKNNEKSASKSFYAASIHTNKTEAFPLEEKVNFLMISPDLITNFDGTKRMFKMIMGESNKELEEFIPFYSSLNELYDFTLNKDKIVENFNDYPKEIINGLIEDLEKYKSTENNGLSLDIDKSLRQVLDHFWNYSNKKYENELYQLTEKDTNMTTVQVLFQDDSLSELDINHQQRMRDMGIKVVFAKQPIFLRNLLKENYPDLFKLIKYYKNQVDNYNKVNQMISIKVPYSQNDSNDGLIFWFNPSQDLIDLLPQKYSKQLAKEFNLLEREEAICGADINPEEVLLDIWRSCSGAIENLRVFPNPVESNLIIKFNLKEKRNLQISIHSLEGVNILDLKSSNFSEGEITETLNLSKLNKGIYFVVVKSDKGEVTMQRIIKS